MLKVQTAARCFDPCIYDQPTSSAALLKVVPRLARDQAVVQDVKHDQKTHTASCSRVVPVRAPSQVFIHVVTLIRDRAMCASVGLRGPIAALSWEQPLLVWQTHQPCLCAYYSTYVLSISTTWSISFLPERRGTLVPYAETPGWSGERRTKQPCSILSRSTERGSFAAC